MRRDQLSSMNGSSSENGTGRTGHKRGLSASVLVAGLLSATVAAGCHSSSTANLGGFQSSIPADTQFDQLSTGQIQTFCTEIDGFETSSGQVMDSEDLTCLLAGFLAAEFSAAPLTNASVQAACTTAYNQCFAQATSTPPTFNCPSMSALSGCTATIGEYAACINDATKLEEQALQSIPTCADLTVANLTSSSGPAPTTPLPQSCQTVNAKCPALAVGGTTTDYDGGVADSSPATDVGAVDAGWPACPVITGWAISQSSSCYFDCSTNAGSGDPHAFPSCVTSNEASPGLGLPEGPIYCIQSNVAQATCPGQ
jgi:hypothetical protein